MFVCGWTWPVCDCNATLSLITRHHDYYRTKLVSGKCLHGCMLNAFFFEIFASNYGPGPNFEEYLKFNILDHIVKHTAPGAYSKHAPGAVCISNMVLKHIWLKKFIQIINGPGPCGPGAWSWTVNQCQNLQKACWISLNLLQTKRFVTDMSFIFSLQ